MPGKNGLELIKELRQRYPGRAVLILSMYPEDRYAVRALKAGASGYLTKESAPEELVSAIRKVAGGGRYVTPTLGEKLALELEATGWRVCLLEAGGSVYEAETQRLFEGEVVGQAYPMLRDTRVGALGGSTTVIPAEDGDLLDYLNSLKRLQGLDVQRIYPAHGPVIDNAEAGYDWSTYPEILEKAGISWKVYQDQGQGLDAAHFWGFTDDAYIGNYGASIGNATTISGNAGATPLSSV
jgi:hypothetical protein